MDTQYKYNILAFQGTILSVNFFPYNFLQFLHDQSHWLTVGTPVY